MYVNQFCLAMPHEWYIIPLEDSGIDQLSVAMKQWTGSASACCGAKPWVKREPTSRIDSPESNQNAKCPLTVEIQLHRWAGVFCHSAVNRIANNIKGTPTTPWCCPMSLVTDFIVVRQPQAPMSCIRSDFRCQPHRRSDVRSPVYSIFDWYSKGNGFSKSQSSSLPWSHPSDR